MTAFLRILHTLRHALREAASRSVARAARRTLPIRIGVDIRPFYEPLTGVGWYLYHLLHELAKRDDVELYLYGDARLTDRGPSLHADLPPNAVYCSFDLRGLGEISGAVRALSAGAYLLWMKASACDVFFGANYFLPRLLGAVARRRVITVHDLTYKRFPELIQKETLDNLTAMMMREVAVADAIICVSEATRHDLLRYYEVDPQRVVAIHSGVAPAIDPLPVPDLPARYILFVSTIEPRKNLGLLLDAFTRLRSNGEYDGSLVVVGKVGWKSADLVKKLRSPRVIHLDYLDPAQLAGVYGKAEVFVFPSIYEGFGFPLLEAMRHDVPTIAARSSSLPEIGGDATLFFDPGNVEELIVLLRGVLSDQAVRDRLVERGREQVQKFRWDEAATKTLEVLKQAAR